MKRDIHSGGFIDCNNKKVQCGDRVKYHLNNQFGILKEALQDGDAYVKFDDNSNGNVKWNNLEKV